ncbi:unnamed protein product, partial [marine sediment metagenome]
MKSKTVIGVVVALVVVALVVVGVVLPRKPSGQEGSYTIGVNQFATHPLLDAVYRGLIDGLAESGISEETGSKIIFKNANGDQNVAFQINKQFADQEVGMIIPIATPPSQSACKVTETIPIVFAAITDPVKAGI